MGDEKVLLTAAHRLLCILAVAYAECLLGPDDVIRIARETGISEPLAQDLLNQLRTMASKLTD